MFHRKSSLPLHLSHLQCKKYRCRSQGANFWGMFYVRRLILARQSIEISTVLNSVRHIGMVFMNRLDFIGEYVWGS